tara:strand:- start:901 stop:1140 length:240 start_codon:yes stop_codon:yes gene_type:complete
MLVRVSKEGLIGFLLDEIKAWERVGGGPNLDAFEFNPKDVDKAELERLGFYDNREAWLAGIRIKKLIEYIHEIKEREAF